MAVSRRRVCVVTGSRAEYGLLSWLMRELVADPGFELQLVVTGMHLMPELGHTVAQVEQDGFPIAARVDMQLGRQGDGAVAICRSMALGLVGLAEAYQRLQPELVVLLGDRFEILAAATSATVARLPIAHLHGGERTEAAWDESFRHAITKMSHLHFTSTEEYRQRVVQLGEDPARVFNVGAIGLDAVRKAPLLDRPALEQALGFRLHQRNLMITFHSVTLEDDSAEAQTRALLEALDARELADTGLIFSAANADTGGQVINRLIGEYVARQPSRAVVRPSLGQLVYLSVLAQVDAVVGNSSSGLIEAPSFRIPTVNIGDRQKGRLRAASVIDCPPTMEGISQALQRALSPEVRSSLANVRNPHGAGDTAERIMAILRQPLPPNLLFKLFHDSAPPRSSVGPRGDRS